MEPTPTAGGATFRALLVTDVVDSTAVAQVLGEVATARLWAAHDRVARDLLVRHRGREIDKTDGFLLLFDAASDAVAYAIEYHRAITALEPPLAARVGLHVGRVILAENRPDDVARGAKPLEVEGLAKPVAARVASVAGRGQTLLTAEARAALARSALRVESHGHWRLKGVERPVELFEVGDEAAPFTPPPDGAKAWRVVEVGGQWLPVREVPHHLPSERDAFVGRDSDLQELARCLDQGASLVSVLGVGGTGKTRLVIRFAWTWLGDWPGGAWFCDLTEARTIEDVMRAVARTFDVVLDDTDPAAQLGHAIASRGPCLVVLDNFEQVARYAAGSLGRWLDRAREARFVVTTREILGLPGETTLALSPLSGGEAFDLFVTRATQARRDFHLADTDRPVVEALVALLDGLPLAIELAAARVRVMAPKMLLERMSDRFRLLAGASGRSSRHTTLRAALDWSWELLSDAERSGLGQLTVFEGGFSLDGAEAVLDLTAFSDAPWTLDLVQALVDKSWIRSVGEARFDLLVAVREYGYEQLRTPGRFTGSGLDALRQAEVRHGAWFARTDGAPRTTAELANRIVACRRAVIRGDGPLAVGTLDGAWQVLRRTGPNATGAELAAAVLTLPDLGAADAAVARYVAWDTSFRAGRFPDALAHAEAGILLRRQLGDRALESYRHADRCQTLLRLGRPHDARAACERALELAREVGHAAAEYNAQLKLAAVALAGNQRDEAEGHALKALELASRVDRSEDFYPLVTLGLIHLTQRRFDEARADFETALAWAIASDQRSMIGGLLCNLGLVASSTGYPAEAAAYSERALPLVRAAGNREYELKVSRLLGHAALVLGRSDAGLHLRVGLALATEMAQPQQVADLEVTLGHLALLEGRLDDAEAHAARGAEAAHQSRNANWQAHAVRLRGLVAARRGRPEVAREDFLAAAALLDPQRDTDHQQGHPLGDLALLDAQAGRFAEARERLERAVAILRVSGDGVALARVLADRAEVERLAGETAAAAAALEEAQGLADRAGTGPSSPLGQRLVEVARVGP